ncbi:MAG TPA: hypothetical protein VGE97_03230 [Nitrososphaera sp.]|jgi:hypothetical protein
MSNPNRIVKKLLEDRIEFKFYAAEKHLQILSDMEAEGETPDNSKGRLNWEMEIEELLFHLIGAMDYLLVRINERLNLKLETRKVTAINVCKKLRLKKRNDLIKELWDLLNPRNPVHSWLKILTDLRYTDTHRSIINVSFAGGNRRITFVEDPKSELEIIPYLDDRIQRMRDLIDNIIRKDPSLRRKLAPKKRRS